MQKLINDTLKDKDGTWNSLKIMRNLAYGLGLVLAVASVFGDWYSRPISFETWFTLLVIGLGSHAGRVYEIQQNRKTKDGNGNDLIQVGTETSPAVPVIPAETAAIVTRETAVAISDESELASQAI